MCIWHFSRIPSAKLEDLHFVFSIIPKADENGNFLLFFYFRIHGGKVCETVKRFNSMKAFMFRKRGYHSRFRITPQEKFPCCFSESFKHSSSFSYYVLSWYKFHCNTGSFSDFFVFEGFLDPKNQDNCAVSPVHTKNKHEQVPFNNGLRDSRYNNETSDWIVT